MLNYYNKMCITIIYIYYVLSKIQTVLSLKFVLISNNCGKNLNVFVFKVLIPILNLVCRFTHHNELKKGVNKF